MKAINFSRRLLFRLLPATSMGLYLSNRRLVAQETLKSPENNPDTAVPAKSFLLQMVSLIPKSKMPVGMATVSLNQALKLAPIVGLPILVRVDRDDINSSNSQEFYSIKVLGLDGRIISEMNVADRSSATFVDERIQISLTAFGI